MLRACCAGLLYFAIVFAAGFMFGTVRTVLVAPVLGELVAVVIELPLILALAWLVCGWTIRRFAVPSTTDSRAIMGFVALVILLISEMLVSTQLAGRSLAAHVALYATLPGTVGLAGQFIFAFFPVLHLGKREGAGKRFR